MSTSNPTPPAQRLDMADLMYMAQLSRRAGATLAKRADGTWDPADLTDALHDDSAAVLRLVAEGAGPEALAPAMADLFWSLLTLADEQQVDLATAFDQRIASVLTDIRQKLVSLDVAEQLN